MARYSELPFPDSPGSWLSAFRHRVKSTGTRPISPEELGRRIGCSGATVRRWEGNLLTPDEDEIARISDVCRLSPLQTAFLSAAFSHAHALPAPSSERFHNFMARELHGSYPAVLIDGLYFVRARNSYVTSVPITTDGIPAGAHPIGTLLDALPAEADQLAGLEALRTLVRIFWMETARLSHRPEYAALVRRFRDYPEFCQVWLDLATGDGMPDEPIAQARPVTYDGRRYLIFTRRIFFPPEYQILVFVPDNEPARQMLAGEQANGPAEVFFTPALHWLEAPLASRRPFARAPRARTPPAQP